ncbi:SRPBCC family protein [Candidatus Halocynthiibacter alkanivorans]|uniref:SRPBCC family protein n=1 Tax=Candidatus Halocynthiibacter alkanivorans TaxID=2267619 RepID=UPI000DF39CFE|nr:SRPBCC domain-containing protein [Candidatus Halocynthiibacter alkanivorans]
MTLTATKTKTEILIEKKLHLAAPKSRVFDHLTRADLLASWFHRAEADLVQGQPFRLLGSESQDPICWGEVLEIRAPDYMKWSFTVAPAEGQMSTVEWWLSDTPGGTLLVLRHSGLPQAAEALGLTRALDKGWHGFLNTLIALCEG